MAIVDTIVVPQGAEHQAVRQGCVQSLGFHQSQVQILPIPIGPTALQDYLTDCVSRSMFQPSARVLVLGLCGSLSARCDVGTPVIYQTCLDGTSVTDDSLPCDRHLTQALIQQFSGSIRSVTALTSDRLIQSSLEKQTLGQTTQAEVVDMEGYPILEVLGQVGAAVAMIRVVSDSITQDLPNLTTAVSEEGKLQPWPLAWGMMRQPIAAAHLIYGSLRGLWQLKTIATVVTQAVSEPHPLSDSPDQQCP